MTYECNGRGNKTHIAIIYGSQPCPLCACHAEIEEWKYASGLVRGENIKSVQHRHLTAHQGIAGMVIDAAVARLETLEKSGDKWESNEILDAAVVYRHNYPEVLVGLHITEQSAPK